MVFTGTLETMTRSKPKLGRKPSSASRGFGFEEDDYVVAGPGAGSKAKKAEELDVPILSEEGWNDLASRRLDRSRCALKPIEFGVV